MKRFVAPQRAVYVVGIGNLSERKQSIELCVAKLPRRLCQFRRRLGSMWGSRWRDAGDKRSDMSRQSSTTQVVESYRACLRLEPLVPGASPLDFVAVQWGVIDKRLEAISECLRSGRGQYP